MEISRLVVTREWPPQLLEAAYGCTPHLSSIERLMNPPISMLFDYKNPFTDPNLLSFLPYTTCRQYVSRIKTMHIITDVPKTFWKQVPYDQILRAGRKKYLFVRAMAKMTTTIPQFSSKFFRGCSHTWSSIPDSKSKPLYTQHLDAGSSRKSITHKRMTCHRAWSIQDPEKKTCG